MKTKNKIEKIKKVDTATIEISGTTTNPQSTSTLIAEPLKVNPFSGDFGRVDINLLRDKVNEIIDYINKN